MVDEIRMCLTADNSRGVVDTVGVESMSHMRLGYKVSPITTVAVNFSLSLLRGMCNRRVLRGLLYYLTKRSCIIFKQSDLGFVVMLALHVLLEIMCYNIIYTHIYILFSLQVRSYI